MTRFQKLLSLAAAAAGLTFAQVDYLFTEGADHHKYQLSTSEVYALKAPLGVEISKSEAWKGASGKVLTLKRGLEQARKQHRANRDAKRVAGEQLQPVFYDTRELPAAARLAAMTEADRNSRMVVARRVMSEKLLVRMEEARWADLAPTSPVAKKSSLLKGWMLIEYPDAFAALDAADWLAKAGGWEFTPVFIRAAEKRQTLQRSVNDPLYPNQWHLAGSGLNVNIGNVWDSVTGQGINMAVVDDGLEVGHEDLEPNSFPISSGFHINFNGGPANDPSPQSASENHGTDCAGLAAARGFNGIGVVGVAPEAKLMGIRLIGAGSDATDEQTGMAMTWQPDGIVTHVSSNSWGPPDVPTSLARIGPLQTAGLETGATKNRGGLGTVFAIAAGNGRGAGDNESYDAFSSSRFAIAVAAVTRDGKQSSYSESGMAVAIGAFGGEFNPGEVTWTTNNSGDEALAYIKGKFPTSEAPVNYTDAMNGTSAATPQVSGAAALILQKNPRLSYRDVKEILMRSARREGLVEGDEFVANSGGFTFSHSFGAGLLNVAAAVELAGTWKNLGPLVSGSITNKNAVAIPDEGRAEMEIDLSTVAAVRIEHVELVVNIKHAKRGMLAIGIISPSGMLSLAEPRPLDDGADYVDYQFTSVRHWGETANGVWKIVVLDTAADGTAGELTSATMRLYGTAQ